MFVFFLRGQTDQCQKKANIEGRNREECSEILVFVRAVMSRFVTMMKENVTKCDIVVV
mgnify:CR=1 FL=1